MRRRTPAALLPALLAGALLAGCSDADTPSVTTDDAGATTTADAGDDAATSTGPEVAEQTEAPAENALTAANGGFRVTVPAGWVDVTDQVEQEVEIAARAGEMSDGFYTNVVVDRENPINDLEASLEQAAQDIAGEDGSYEMLDPVQVAGEEALGYTVTRTVEGVEIAQTQRWIPHGDHLYVVTLSVAASRAEEGEKVLADLLDGWEWRD